MVSVQDFLNAFSQQWNADRECRGRALRDACKKGKMSTDYMLKENSFFARLAEERLGQQVLLERQYLDVIYYTTKAHNIEHTPRPHPACFNVIIEHEIGEKVEEEMWKLLMWRAPLKVLVWYDRQAPGLDAKLRQLDALRQEVNREWPEADKTTYLFLVGQPQEGNELPLWWYSYCDSSEKTRRPLKPMRLKIVKSHQDSFGES